MVVEKYDEEAEWDHPNLNLGTTTTKGKEKQDLQVKFFNEHCDMEDATILNTTLFKMFFNQDSISHPYKDFIG